VLPFIGSALLILTAPPEAAGLAWTALLVYGAVILSFIGGIRWGMAIQEPANQGMEPAAPLWQPLLVSVAPSLAGWVALLLPPPLPPFVLAAGFLAMLRSDWRAARTGGAPPWYPLLRWPPTAIAVTSLLAVGLA
jgi:hypothetical protein